MDKNWIEDFTAAESSAVKGKEKADWDQMFSAIEAGRIEQTETVKNKLAADDEFSKTFEDTWKTLENVELSESISQQLNKQQQDTETPISDELDYARWDDEMASLSAPPKIMETKDYAFEPSNKYLQHSDPYAEGVRIVESGGSLTEAALAFEAAVQLDSRHANAWAYLGKVQAENEKEEPAIAALQQAIKENPQHLEALMVSVS